MCVCVICIICMCVCDFSNIISPKNRAEISSPLAASRPLCAEQMPRHRSAPPKLLIAARSVRPGPGGFGSHGALAYLGMGPGRIRCQMMLVLGEKPRLIRLHVPWFFFHMYFVVERCAASRSAASVWQASWGDITSLYIYIYIISLSSLDVCWLPTPRTFWRWVRTCYRKSPVCWSLGWGRFQVFFPYWLTETITHITHQKHIHISTFTLLLPIALRWWWKEREREEKTHHRKHWSCLYSPHLEIHQHCLFSILFCATLWPSPQELRGSITLCGAILGDLQHLQNLRHVITAQPGTGLLFLGITWRRRRKTKWRQEDKREELWCWTGVGDGMYSCGGLGRQYDASNVISKEAKALGFC